MLNRITDSPLVVERISTVRESIVDLATQI